MLFLVATPIGNLADITFRAIEVLQSCDLILCEDTRHSLKLLNHYAIKKPLLSYHKFNEASTIPKIIEMLRDGKKIALISDAGTPLIADPGYKLVEACLKDGISATAIPGACAAVDALLLSGFETERFQFIGFLPKQQKQLKAILQEASAYPGVTICYESPDRIAKTIAVLPPHLHIAIARELTKKFETVLRGTAAELAIGLSNKPAKGECILLIKGDQATQDFSHLSVEEHISQIEHIYSISRKEAIKIVAEQRGLPKRTIYNQTIASK